MQENYAKSPVRRSILIVEDEAMISMMLEEFVETLGHEVRGVASTVDEACQMVREGGFDLAVVDCNLNGEEVWPATELLEQAGIPYILSSGGSISSVPQPYSARPMLPKPYTIGAISDLIEAAEVGPA